MDGTSSDQRVLDVRIFKPPSSEIQPVKKEFAAEVTAPNAARKEYNDSHWVV
jgi:hypothetical protein